MNQYVLLQKNPDFCSILLKQNSFTVTKLMVPMELMDCKGCFFFSFQISSNLFKLLYLSYIFILGYLRSLFVKEIVLLLSVWLKRSDVQQKVVFHCLYHIKKDSAGTKGSGI